MKTRLKFISTCVFTVIIFFNIITIEKQEVFSQDYSILNRSFNLTGERSQKVQYFLMKTKVVSYSPDGKITGTDIYKLNLKCVPAKLAGKEGDEFTCSKFRFKLGDSKEVTVPALEGWRYIFKSLPSGIDEKGQVFGIEHSKFENLKDSNNKSIPQDKIYMIYNTFIDFHSFCNVFAERTENGKGIQDLKKIGQKIVHTSSFSEPPLNLGSNIAEGSFFKNGKITLTFKGLSYINNKLCAIVGFDAGGSSFKMIINVSPDTRINTTGSSHYKGDIYIDIESKWVQKVVMDEFVVSEVILPFPPNKINSFVERNVVVRNVEKDEFEKYLK